MITRFAKTEKQLIFTIMVVVGVMSGFLQYRYRSRTDPGRYRRGGEIRLCPFPVADAAGFAAALGGNLSLIGAPGNLIAQSALQNIGSGFGF